MELRLEDRDGSPLYHTDFVHGKNNVSGIDGIDVSDLNGNKLASLSFGKKPGIIRKWRGTLKLTLPEQAPIDIQCKHAYYHTLRFELGGDLYEVYDHHGQERSVYKNDIQVAHIDKKRDHFFDSRCYILNHDSRIDPVLLLAISQSNELCEARYSSNANVGWITSPNKAKRNPNWRPRS